MLLCLSLSIVATSVCKACPENLGACVSGNVHDSRKVDEIRCSSTQVSTMYPEQLIHIFLLCKINTMS